MPRRLALDDARPGDIVLVRQRGRVFHATVRGRGVGGFVVEPLDRTVRARRAAAEEVVDLWLRAEPAPVVPAGQLALVGGERSS